MKHLPFMAKVVLNVFLYLVYVLFVSLAFSLLFPLILQVLGKEVLDPSLPENIALFNKIQIFIAIATLLVSLILRKYFYISLKKNTEIKTTPSYTATKKSTDFETIVTKEEKKAVKHDDDDEIKIYVEKEIK